MVGILTGEVARARRPYRSCWRDLDQVVRELQRQACLQDEYVYLFLDGVSLRMWCPTGRKRVHMLVAYGRRDGAALARVLLRSRGESQAEWGGLLEDLYRRGRKAKNLLLIVTDGLLRPAEPEKDGQIPGS